MLWLRILVRNKKINQAEANVLIKKEIPFEPRAQPESMKFMSESVWTAVLGLESVEIFSSLSQQMESEALQWRKWYQDEKSEEADLPKSCKDISAFQKTITIKSYETRSTHRCPYFIYLRKSRKAVHWPASVWHLQNIWRNEA